MSTLVPAFVDDASWTPGRLATALRRRLWHRAELRVYRYPAERVAALPRPQRMARDRWEDLERFERTSRHFQQDRGAYLMEVSGRRTQGHHLYTFVEHGRLLHYGWLIPRQSCADDARIGMRLHPEDGTATLYDFYTHPRARGRGLYTDALRQMVHDAVALEGATQVYVYVNDDNLPSRRAVEAGGFEYIGGLVREQRLWLVRRFSTVARLGAAPL